MKRQSNRRLGRQLLLAALALAGSVPLDAQQVSINRVELMPGLPTPYLMRDWRAVARAYDSLVFDLSRIGQYLPLVAFFPAVNYPSHAGFGLHTYVGTASPQSFEAINALPALVSATLSGIDKNDEAGTHWVLLGEEYFNNRSSEYVYLNHPSSSSGDDWWYETMPNVFFQQLAWLYPGTGDFDRQFRLVAERWLQAVRAMGGSAAPWRYADMDHRAWSLSTMTPNNQGVHEPEAAGAIAWLLYNAYARTGNETYRMGAEWSMEFLQSRFTNPAYELQLPYGAYLAARMNAELGTGYDVLKMLNWCFDPGSLRNWGVTVGTWGGYDCSGLVGELTFGYNYAFAMNTFEQVGALTPLVRYDERFARAIGKWVLNAANASRLFYPLFLPDQNQDSEAWSRVHDTASVIAYEALKQNSNGIQPYATGDAMRGGWAATNLALYGSSHAGILGGIIETTAVKAVLRLNLLATDYYRQAAFPTYLIYNPYPTDTTVLLTFDSGAYDLYELTRNQFLQQNVGGSAALQLPADDALVIAVLPAGGTVYYDLDRMLVNGVVVDFHAGRTVENYPPRIKGLGAAPATVVRQGQAHLYCTASARDLDTLTYSWHASHGSITGSGPHVVWNAPDTLGEYTIACVVSDRWGAADSASLAVTVVAVPPSVPLIRSLTADPLKLDLGGTSAITCSAYEPSGYPLVYHWSWADTATTTSDSILTWQAPLSETDVTIRCTVDNGVGGQATDSIALLVRDFSLVHAGHLLAHYPLDGNALDLSGNGRNGTAQNVTVAPDRLGAASGALAFNGSSSAITVPNDPGLNCDSAITVAFWMNPGAILSREQHPVSHGSWQNRWKVSLGPDRHLRWTVKTSAGTKDLDSRTLLSAGHWLFVTCTYNGRDVELYLDGTLDAFGHWTGLLLSSPTALTIGQVLPTDYNYGFQGLLDDVRIFDYALSVSDVDALYHGTTDVPERGKAGRPMMTALLGGYPNPFNPATTVYFSLAQTGRAIIRIHDLLGRAVATLADGLFAAGVHSITWNPPGTASGMYVCTLQAGGQRSSLKLMLLR